MKTKESFRLDRKNVGNVVAHLAFIKLTTLADIVT